MKVRRKTQVLGEIVVIFILGMVAAIAIVFFIAVKSGELEMYSSTKFKCRVFVDDFGLFWPCMIDISEKSISVVIHAFWGYHTELQIQRDEILDVSIEDHGLVDKMKIRTNTKNYSLITNCSKEIGELIQ